MAYLRPYRVQPPLEGQTLNRFMHDVIAGLTGLADELVRPRWQAEPANIPAAGEAWAAYGFGVRRSDTFPQIIHRDGLPPANYDVPNNRWDESGLYWDGGDGGYDQIQRQEVLPLIVSFYDLGSNGLADQYAALCRDSLAIEQNRAAMASAGFFLAYTGDLVPVPIVLKTRWLYRVDFDFTIRRSVERDYRVFNIVSAHGILYSQNAKNTLEQPILVEPPENS